MLSGRATESVNYCATGHGPSEGLQPPLGKPDAVVPGFAVPEHLNNLGSSEGTVLDKIQNRFCAAVSKQMIMLLSSDSTQTIIFSGCVMRVLILAL